MIPHFFVVGAQRAGTTAVCDLLKHYPGVSLSIPKEPMILSRDNPQLHADFFVERKQEWLAYDFRDNYKTIIDAYKKKFTDSGNGTICGEGSTTYMPSGEAAKRIHDLNPDARIIFMLRNPVNRAWSAYWHFVYKGTAFWTFEKQLQFDSQNILSTGLYKSNIEQYME